MISISSAKCLSNLIDEKTINGSTFKDKSFLNNLVEDGILNIIQTTPSRKKIVLNSKIKLDDYLKNKYKIDDLEQYIVLLEDKNSTRADNINISENSKSTNINPQTGLYISGYEDFEISINQKAFNILNIVQNSSLFIHKNCDINIDENILIIGIENSENLLFIQKQKYLFNHIKKKKLFILINSTMLKFIGTIKNEYLHFGDFDLAGIAIYEHKIKQKVNKSKFFIPVDIESLIKNSKNDKLYFNQFEKYKKLKSEDKNIQDLINIIHKYKKVLEQEYFINNDK